jgi:hypothetical protein
VSKLHRDYLQKRYLEESQPIIDLLAKIDQMAGCRITIENGEIVKTEMTLLPELEKARVELLKLLEAIRLRLCPVDQDQPIEPGQLQMGKPEVTEREDGTFDVRYRFTYRPFDFTKKGK